MAFKIHPKKPTIPPPKKKKSANAEQGDVSMARPRRDAPKATVLVVCAITPPLGLEIIGAEMFHHRVCTILIVIRSQGDNNEPVAPVA